MASNWAGYGAATSGMNAIGTGGWGGNASIGPRMGGDQWGSGLPSPRELRGLYSGAENMLGQAQAGFATAGNNIQNPYTTDVANMQAGVGRENVAATYGGKKRALQAGLNSGRLSQGQYQSLMGQLGRDESAESASQTREPMIEQAKSAQAFDLQKASLAEQQRGQMLSGYTALFNILRQPLQMQHPGGAVQYGAGYNPD